MINEFMNGTSTMMLYLLTDKEVISLTITIALLSILMGLIILWDIKVNLHSTNKSKAKVGKMRDLANENDTIKCPDCQKNWWGWAINDNLGCCPDCKRPLDYEDIRFSQIKERTHSGGRK